MVDDMTVPDIGSLGPIELVRILSCIGTVGNLGNIRRHPPHEDRNDFAVAHIFQSLPQAKAEWLSLRKNELRRLNQRQCGKIRSKHSAGRFLPRAQQAIAGSHASTTIGHSVLTAIAAAGSLHRTRANLTLSPS